jgi:bifunctional non-homologous end joining protein LigD
VGTGFDAETHQRLVRRLRRLAQAVSPFADAPTGSQIQFVAPRLVAEVEYRRWPKGGSIQLASFRALRDDKLPRDIVLPEGE